MGNHNEALAESVVMARGLRIGQGADSVVALVTFFIWILVTVIWAVIGLILWIPLLIRTILLFTGSVVAEAITRKNYTGAVEQMLRYAIMFYPGAFQIIRDSIYDDPELGHWEFSVDWKILLGEVLWTAVVWFVIDGWFYDFI